MFNPEKPTEDDLPRDETESEVDCGPERLGAEEQAEGPLEGMLA
jgi:hypothetical protein